MALLDNDNLIIGRGSSSYKISYAELKNELGTGGGGGGALSQTGVSITATPPNQVPTQLLAQGGVGLGPSGIIDPPDWSWYKDNVLIPDATTDTLNVTDPGTYKAVATVVDPSLPEGENTSTRERSIGPLYAAISMTELLVSTTSDTAPSTVTLSRQWTGPTDTTNLSGKPSGGGDDWQVPEYQLLIDDVVEIDWSTDIPSYDVLDTVTDDVKITFNKRSRDNVSGNYAQATKDQLIKFTKEEPIVVNFVLVGGGGAGKKGNYAGTGEGGGGGGGYISSVAGELSGGNTAPVAPLDLVSETSTFQLTVGAAGSDTKFSGPIDATGTVPDAFDYTAPAGEDAFIDANDENARGGNSGNGFPGSNDLRYSECSREDHQDVGVCSDTSWGAGGGAGSAASGKNGGDGIETAISGPPIYLAGGAAGKTNKNGSYGTDGKGKNSPGGGGTGDQLGQDGIVYLSYPPIVDFEDIDGNFAFRTFLVGQNRCTEITGGTGTFRFITV